MTSWHVDTSTRARTHRAVNSRRGPLGSRRLREAMAAAEAIYTGFGAAGWPIDRWAGLRASPR